MNEHSNGCRLCPRQCDADRSGGTPGYCGVAEPGIYAARAALHLWEEPCISGETGSGAVFFSGCPLRCVYCQNYSIARAQVGKTISVERLAEIFLELQQQQVANINLVTPTHYTPQIIEAVTLARNRGLRLPSSTTAAATRVWKLSRPGGDRGHLSHRFQIYAVRTG